MLGRSRVASFPGSYAPEREIEVVQAWRAWYFLSPRDKYSRSQESLGTKLGLGHWPLDLSREAADPHVYHSVKTLYSLLRHYKIICM